MGEVEVARNQRFTSFLRWVIHFTQYYREILNYRRSTPPPSTRMSCKTTSEELQIAMTSSEWIDRAVPMAS
jgi:hypothetical protein